MSHRMRAVLMVVVCVVAAIVFRGCQKPAPDAGGDVKSKPAAGKEGPSDSGSKNKAAAEEGHASPSGFSLKTKHDGDRLPPKPLFESWPAPQAALVLSGEMHGYVEPCGCSLHQLGGLSRRADLFRQIREKGWPVTAFDAGGLVSNPTRKQAKVKMRMALDALKDLKYAGIALGVEELRLGDDLLTYTGDDRQPFLSCNLVLFGEADIGIHQPRAIVETGAMRIGVTAVFGEALKHLVAGAGQEGDVKVLDPVESLTKTVGELEAEKPDLLVLLSHAPLDDSKKLAERFPQFDVVVSIGGPEDPNPRPEHVGKTLLVAPGQKGKSVAVVGFYPKEKENRLRYEVVTFDEDRFRDTPAMIEHMRQYQDRLAVQDLVAGDPAINDPRNDEFAQQNSDNPQIARLADMNEYVGAKVCAECHQKSYDKWLSTSHAKATQSIKTGRKGQEATYISRINDSECVACHVTGWDPGRGNPKSYYRYKSGFTSEQASPHLLGQQCENCHGPGGQHAELERRYRVDKQETAALTKFREFVQLSSEEAGAKLCLKCHDGDNDPHFKTDGDVFAEYWKEIKHPWRD